VHRFPQTPELRDLCNSGPFDLFCRSTLPTEHERLICTACGLPKAPRGPAEHQRSTCIPPGSQPGGHALHRAGHEELSYITDPQELHEAQGLPPWTAPYVWDTNY